jgi:hypothetical protein
MAKKTNKKDENPKAGNKKVSENTKRDGDRVGGVRAANRGYE